MSWRGFAFASFAPFTPFSGKGTATEASIVPRHIRGMQFTRAVYRPARFRSSLGPPAVPEDIKELDELERKRREDLASQPPPPRLLEETKTLLFEKYPHIKAMDEKMTALMREEDYDPEDHRVYSWAYQKLRPWAPGVLCQVLMAVGTVWSLRAVWRAVRERFSIPVIVGTLIRMETIYTVVLTVAIPAVICMWAIAKSRNDFRTDGVRRAAIMYTLSSILLLPVAAIASVGHAAAAAAAGTLVRLLPMSMSLWYWRDLRREVFLGSALLAHIFRVWRFFTTFLVVIGGCFLRIAGIIREQQFPSARFLAKSAEDLRLRLGKSFPVAFSLCNDPRGLFFGACVALSAGVVYGIYVGVYVTDFGRIQDHRKTDSILTTALIHADLYQPNEHPLKKINGLSCPESESSFLPSPAMMLRPQDDLITVDSGLLSDETPMPIFGFLDKEDEISDGVGQWLRPRYEQVPLSENLSRLKRSRDALLAWARPLDEKEADMTFAEFFETLDDDEFRYDSGSGNWVFEDEDVPGDNGAKNSKLVEDIMNANDESEIDTADLEKVIRDLGDINLKELASSPELDPLLRREILDEKLSDGDDADDPSVTVFV